MNFKRLFSNKNYPKFLFGLFALFWILIAIAPRYRGIWFAENVPAVIFLIFLVLTYKKFRFSNFTYGMMFLFLTLHTVGSYYSYSEMYLFNLLESALNLSRNYYDRVVHFLFGLVFFFPTYEIIYKKFKIKSSWAFLLVFLLIVSFKGIFEIFEWLFVLITSEKEIMMFNYLGMQGDVWDAQKDIFSGMVGAFLSWIMLEKTPSLRKKVISRKI